MQESPYLWELKSFNNLTATELYLILQLRNEIFVVEQNCPYQDCDGKDFEGFHLCCFKEKKLVAYARLLPKGVSYNDAASIGRVVVDASERGKSLGKELMKKSIKFIDLIFGKVDVKIGAQSYLRRFYESLSFDQVLGTQEYLEDGIPHLTMQLNRQ